MDERLLPLPADLWALIPPLAQLGEQAHAYLAHRYAFSLL
jgi:hypothetical protein